MKNLKNWISLLLVAVALFSLTSAALAETPVIKKVQYEGFGYVDVDFRGRVQYSDVRINVIDAEGRSYDASIWEMDDDDISFNVANIVDDMSYQFTVSGVRSGNGGAYESVSGSFTVPAAGSPAIREIDYDRDDGELEIEFVGRMQYQNLSASVTDASGKIYEARVIERDGDSVDLYVGGLERGAEYSVQVTGVRTTDSSEYTSVSGTFTVR